MTQVERVALWFAVGASVANILTMVAWWLVVVAAVALVCYWLYEEYA